MRNHTRRGLTITEVIVVVAILIILAGITFSVMGGAIRKSKVTVSTENLRQIHIALMLYEQDHGDLPPQNIYKPGLRPYFHGPPPEPPLAPPLSSRRGEQIIRYGYHIHGRRKDFYVDQLTKACFDQRGESLPIAHDANFREPSYIMRNHEGFYLYVRRDGSVGRDPRDVLSLLESRPQEFPCPGVPHWFNFK